jgi:hypothetical protein
VVVVVVVVVLVVVVVVVVVMVVVVVKQHNNLNGKYWVIFGPKLSGPPGNPDYQGTMVLQQELFYNAYIF